ncbi:MAG TPA: DUF421 domain-containing protein [Bacillus sp. (in: firmicutes)]|nr:DUF421 domain-containing protein [Bacillus sp. (in: firmicutes)]
MYVSIAFKLILGLAALLIVTRILGKKEMAQITPFDFIYALMLGGILEEGVYDDKVSILHILFALALWAILIYIIEVAVQKVDKLKRPLKGEPSPLIVKGQINLKEMKKNNMEMEQLRSMLREKGIFSLKEVECALLETSGTLSVLKNAKYSTITPDMLNVSPPQNSPSVLVVDEGKVREKTLNRYGKNKEWLLSHLKSEGYDNIKNIFYAEWTEQNGFYIKTYDECKS